MQIHRSTPAPAAGFSLLDMLFAMVVLGILVALAVPGFTSTIRKSRRADAIQALRTVQLSQERWRSNHSTYGTTSDILSTTSSPGGWYTLAISSPTATGYTATATAVGGSTQTSDTASGVSCATLSVNQDAPTPPAQSACWSR
jgi:type IV pilus assembly protein PilE